jgi:hypothetical protein
MGAPDRLAQLYVNVNCDDWQLPHASDTFCLLADREERMIKTVALLVGALAIASPGLAHPQEPAAAARVDAQTKQREIDTNRALLQTLEARRTALGARTEANREALDFLDSRIALTRARLEASERR